MKQSLNLFLWPAIAGVLAALLILDRWVLPAQQAERDNAAPASYAAAVSDATPSVVNIYTTKLVPNPGFAARQDLETALGSGVIMTAQGHILTNQHVIADADAIHVMLHDGRTARASVIGVDTDTDLAVLKIGLPGLQPIDTGDDEKLRVGDVVLAIGNPFGFGHSVTQGIVSALGRYGLNLSPYEDYIQTDATIHPGNSGGALIDTRGRLLGINTLIFTGSDPNDPRAGSGAGINLATPVNLAVYVMRDLIDYGQVIRGWLGVRVEPVVLGAGDGSYRLALRVIKVERDGPAERAGVQLGDIITYIDGEPVRDGRLTMHRIAMLKPGERVAIALRRDGEEVELHAVVGVLGENTVNTGYP